MPFKQSADQMEKGFLQTFLDKNYAGNTEASLHF
jgi:hypothetical protein